MPISATLINSLAQGTFVGTTLDLDSHMLNSCKLNERDIRRLSVALSRGFSKIVTLNLNNNSLHGVLKPLFDCLHLTTIEELFLQGNELRCGDIKYFSTIIENTSLKKLDLMFNRIDDDGFIELFKMLPRTKLTMLSFYCNGGGELSYSYLKHVLPNTRLVSLPTIEDMLDMRSILAANAIKKESDRFDVNNLPHVHNKWRIPYAALEMKESDRIDGGGFGDVFKGRWKHQPVAIKRAKKNSEPLESSSQAMRAATEDAHREAAIMLDLEHHYIVRFKGLVEESNRPIMIVMEFVAGGSLYKRLYEDGGEITWQMRLRIAHGLTCGLAFLHSEGILHCDIKSKNVLLTESGEPKWCDFGLSKLKQEVQEGNFLAGTLQWMAPELLIERIHSQASDIWALGKLFYELAAREEPYSDKNGKDEIMAAILEKKGLPIPVECMREAPSFGGLMTLCWKERNSRPTAETLEKRLRPFVIL